MIRLLVILLLLCLLQAGGCTGRQRTNRSEPPSPMAGVALGMDADDVRSALGAPDTVDERAGQGIAVWSYLDAGVVILEDDKVVFTYPPAAAGSERER